jgi:spermidine/putrescine transport system permease protein
MALTTEGATGSGLERARRRRVLILLAPGAILIIATYVLPGVLIFIYSFLTPRLGGGVQWELSLDAYRNLLSPQPRALLYNNFVSVLARSVIWAALATAACFALSLPVAVFISNRRSDAVKYALLVAVMIPFWTSMLVRTYALRYLLANTGPVNELLGGLGFDTVVFLNTRIAVILGLVYTALPFMILPLYASIARLDQRILEAGRDLGAAPIQNFRRVFLPMISAGVVVGSTLVFVLSVSQYIVPTLLGGGKVNMIANLIDLQFGEAFNWPFGAAIAVVFSVIALTSLWIVTGRREEAGLL